MAKSASYKGWIVSKCKENCWWLWLSISQDSLQGGDGLTCPLSLWGSLLFCVFIQGSVRIEPSLEETEVHQALGNFFELIPNLYLIGAVSESLRSALQADEPTDKLTRFTRLLITRCHASKDEFHPRIRSKRIPQWQWSPSAYLARNALNVSVHDHLQVSNALARDFLILLQSDAFETMPFLGRNLVR